MKTLIRSLSFFLMSVALMSGCASWRLPSDCRVTVAPDLGDSVQIVDLRLQKAHSQHYTMQANVVNNSASLVGIEYKTVWLDAGGEEIPTILSTWARTSIRPRDIVALQSTAPDESAVDFRLYVKRTH